MNKRKVPRVTQTYNDNPRLLPVHEQTLIEHAAEIHSHILMMRSYIDFAIRPAPGSPLAGLTQHMASLSAMLANHRVQWEHRLTPDELD